MSYEEAKKTANSLNAQSEVIRWGEKKSNIRSRLQKEDTIECAFLPPLLVSEFEQEILFEKLARGSEDIGFRNKVESHWRATKRIIREVSLPPKEWNVKSYRFYNLFVKKKLSPFYVQKLLRILNEWGYYVARKEDKGFLSLPSPRGAEAQRIADDFIERTSSVEGQASDPLYPQLLESKKDNLQKENYNWLFISVWLGLRPLEIDELKKAKSWKLEINRNGRQLLYVYQPKLITVPKPKRWKVIPLKYKE